MKMNKKTLEDKLLLQTYMQGFNDELNKTIKKWNPNPLLLRAYDLGRSDATARDDVKSLDYQSNEEIIKKIRNLI